MTEMRLRNETITLGLKRKALQPVLYERIDANNVRIGTKWFQFKIGKLEVPRWGPLSYGENGVTIYHGETEQFISNSWYPDFKSEEEVFKYFE